MVDSTNTQISTTTLLSSPLIPPLAIAK